MPRGVKAFSNASALSDAAGPDGTRTVRFAGTKPLPWYFVALAVGPFETVDTPPIGRLRVPGRIIVPRGRAAEAAWAASVTPRSVALLEEYFGIRYPLETLDHYRGSALRRPPPAVTP